VRKRKGFTMVELMVVVIIMAILGLAVMPALMGSSEKAKYSRAWNDINAIANAFTAYYGRQGTLPDLSDGDLGGNESLLKGDSLFQSFLGTPIDKLQDPWGNPYKINQGRLEFFYGEGYVIVYVGNGTAVVFDGEAKIESGVRVDPYNNDQPMARLVINVQ
jgi:general secretion pathway protein G